MQLNQSPGWEYHPDGQQPSAPPQPGQPDFNEAPPEPQQPEVDENEVAWTADEYIHHDKNNGWFLVLFIGAILASGVLYLITKDIGTSVIIIVLAGIAAAFARRKPDALHYRVALDGLHIGSKFYPYNLFKSFSVVEDSGLKSIFLAPLKKFMPPLTMFFPPDEEAKIVGLIGNHLPQEQRKTEAVDRLARRLRF